MDGASIRKRIEALGPRKQGGRLPEDLRREIAGYARHRRSEGVKVSDIARETGVSGESVRRWSLSKQCGFCGYSGDREHEEPCGLGIPGAGGPS